VDRQPWVAPAENLDGLVDLAAELESNQATASLILMSPTACA